MGSSDIAKGLMQQQRRIEFMWIALWLAGTVAMCIGVYIATESRFLAGYSRMNFSISIPVR